MRFLLSVLSLLAIATTATCLIGSSGYGAVVKDYETFIVSDSFTNLFNELTFSFWYKPSIPAAIFNSFGLFQDEDLQPIVSMYSYGQLALDFNAFAARAFDPMPFEVGPSGWVHIASSWRASDGLASLYRDGQLVCQTNFQVGLSIPEKARLYIGRAQTPGWSDRFYGIIDEVAVFNKSLSASQILSLKSSVPTAATVPMESLMLYWGFENVDAWGTISSQYGPSNTGRVVKSPFDLYKGLFNVQQLVRAPTHIANFTGSNSVVVHAAPNTPVSIPREWLPSNSSGVPIVDGLPLSGNLYLLAANGVPTVKANAGDPAPYGLSYTGPMTAIDSFSYTVDAESADVFIIPNNAPTPQDTTYYGDQDIGATVLLGTNVYFPRSAAIPSERIIDDVESDPLTVTLLSLPDGTVYDSNGVEVLSVPKVLPSNSITYVPTPGLYGTNATYVSYVVSDSYAQSTIATMSFYLEKSPKPPEAANINRNTTENANFTMNIIASLPVVVPFPTRPAGGGQTEEPYLVRIAKFPAKGKLYSRSGNKTTALSNAVPSVEVFSMWAQEIVDASSEWSDPTGLWGAIQALGEPDVFPIYGDSSKSWAPLVTNNYEWLTFRFNESLHPLNLDVYITWNAGTVYRISALNPESNKFVTLWQGSTESPSVSGQRQAQIFSPKLCPITFASNTYRVDIAPAGPGTYVEIDAVQLTGSRSPLYNSYVDMSSSEVEFVSTPYENGKDTFEFIVNTCSYWSTSRESGVPNAIVSIDIAAINYRPVAFDFSAEINALDQTVIEFGGLVSLNASDPDIDQVLNSVIMSLPTGGLLINPLTGEDITVVGTTVHNLTLLYRPNSCSVLGTIRFRDTFTYKVSDGEFETTVATASVIVDCEGPIQQIHQGVHIFIYIISGVCSLLTVACMILVVIWRNTRTIRSISPVFCLVTLTGALAMNISPIFWVQNTMICKAWLSLITLGFVWMFSAIAVKAYRIDRIFTNRSLEMFAIPNKQLFIYVGVLTLVQVIILIIWNLTTPFETTFVEIPNAKQSLQTCSAAEHNIIFAIIQFIFLILLFLITAVLAWRVRSIPLGQYRETREVFFATYNVGFVALVAVSLSMIQFYNSMATAIIITVGTNFATTASIIILFITKFLRIATDKERSAKTKAGESGWTSSTTGSTSKPSNFSPTTGGRVSDLLRSKQSSVIEQYPKKPSDGGYAAVVLKKMDDTSTSSRDDSSSSASEPPSSSQARPVSTSTNLSSAD